VTVSTEKRIVRATRVELGCGANKRAGFFGIDIAPGDNVDLVLDIERHPLPFADNSIEHLYSSHTFEHLAAAGSPIQTLREIMRVVRHRGLVEIWTPHGRSDDALLFGHDVFYTETHWKHICFEYDDFYLGAGTPGRFHWTKTEYVLYPGILEQLDSLAVPVDFALTHMQNIAQEFGVFLIVDKTRTKAESPQLPVRELSYGRGNVVKRLLPTDAPTAAPPADLRRRMRTRVAATPAGPYLRRLRDLGRNLTSRR
jgi:SAM-dependent methyltransferase